MDSAKMAANQAFQQAVVKAKVAQICDHVGYHAISQDSFNVLSDIYQHLIRNLARHCKEAANNNYRSEATYIDLVQACHHVGISIPSLQEHLETVKLPLKVELQVSPEDERPSNRIQRNLLVDDLLESEKNATNEPADNGAENQEQLEEEEKPLIPLLKDTYAEIANKFAISEPVTADKKIRLGGRIVLPLLTKLKLNTPLPPEPSTGDSAAAAAGKAGKKDKKKKVDRKKGAAIVSTDSLALESSKAKKGDKKKKVEKKKTTTTTTTAIVAAEVKPEPLDEPTPELAIKEEQGVVEEADEGEEQQQQQQQQPEKQEQQVLVKVKKEDKKKKGRVITSKSRAPVVRQPKGKRGKKLSREFILPEDDIDDELLNASKAAPPSVTPLDLAAAEPPSFLPILGIKDEPDAPITVQPESSLLPPLTISPAPQPPQIKVSTSLLSSTNKDKSASGSKQQKSKKKSKKTTSQPLVHITPLDPAIAEPPSFFPILETNIKHEPELPPEEPIKPPNKPSTSLLRLPGPHETAPSTSSKQPKSKKKKKSSSSQFAIVSETVVAAADEKEWFCPACGGPDDGDLMVQCDKCLEWYHLGCTALQKPPEDDEHWECEICINKMKAAQKKPPQPAPPVVAATPPPPVSVPQAQLTPSPVFRTIEQPQKQTKTPEPMMAATSLLAPQQSPYPAPSTGTPAPAVVLDPDLCPECSLADDGTMMIQCDDPFCARWFHGKCVNLLEEPKEDESWFCKACVEKQQSAFKRRRRK